ncbi:hypothetical protein BS17DRAFT_355553 [Gyrodon lividus]|nr:hypothetical protein BS17DRAFT_355553 [Gyrodon lividus]
MNPGPANSISFARTLLPLSIAVVGVGWRLWSSETTSRSTVTKEDPQTPPPKTPLQVRRHPTYWFNDDSVIVRVPSNQGDVQDGDVHFKVHRSLLCRHSSWRAVSTREDNKSVPMITIPPELGVQVQDFTSLLEHLYHDTPLSPEAPFQHVAAILRVSSQNQLDLPSVHSLARSYLVAMFPSGPYPFVHPSHLEEALGLAVQYKITSIQKGLYYSLVMTTDFEPADLDAARSEIPVPSNILGDDGASADLSAPHVLSPTDIERCRNLMIGMVEYFIPVLFTPPATPHMACTDVFADKWMDLVVQSAIADCTLYKPLETLEQIKQLDWGGEGLCPACVRGKREEWTLEQERVWEKMDVWLNLDTKE